MSYPVLSLNIQYRGNIVYTVYKATNIKNNKIYIGATSNLKRRIIEYKSHTQKDKSRFHDAILKYGIENFTFEVILKCNTKEEMFEKEKEVIATFDSTNPEIGYNETSGGRGGKTHDVSGENNPMYGKIYTDEERKAMSDRLKGRTKTAEHRQKISSGLKGKTKSKEHRMNLSKALMGNIPSTANKISVIHTVTGEILTFESETRMERALKCSRATVKSGRITNSGYKLYVEKSQETIESIT